MARIEGEGELRKAADRRGNDRRAEQTPFDHADRRTGERRSGADRRGR